MQSSSCAPCGRVVTTAPVFCLVNASGGRVGRRQMMQCLPHAANLYFTRATAGPRPSLGIFINIPVIESHSAQKDLSSFPRAGDEFCPCLITFRQVHCSSQLLRRCRGLLAGILNSLLQPVESIKAMTKHFQRCLLICNFL